VDFARELANLRQYIRELPPPEPPILVPHSAIGPSSAARLQACSGSYALLKTLHRDRKVLPDAISAAAERGSKEHALAELHLRWGVPPEVTPGVNGGRLRGEAALRYVEALVADAVRAHRVEFLLVEEMLDGRRQHPLFFGTVDGALLWCDRQDRQHLGIYDLKSGALKVAPSALQLQLYAALLLLDPRAREALRHVWMIETVVIQPHAAAKSTASPAFAASAAPTTRGRASCKHSSTTCGWRGKRPVPSATNCRCAPVSTAFFALPAAPARSTRRDATPRSHNSCSKHHTRISRRPTRHDNAHRLALAHP
jgi:hypothetical protein